jgi:hypothetical protein
MHRSRLSAGLLAALFISTTAGGATPTPGPTAARPVNLEALRIRHVVFSLPNGLTVIVAPDPRVPLVARPAARGGRAPR